MQQSRQECLDSQRRIAIMLLGDCKLVNPSQQLQVILTCTRVPSQGYGAFEASYAPPCTSGRVEKRSHVCHSQVESMGRRCQAVIDAIGGHNPY